MFLNCERMMTVKRFLRNTIITILCVITIFLCSCQSAEKEYYSLEDFKTVVVEQSTFDDVCEIVTSPGVMQATSYGGFCDYPTKNGTYIRVKFYGTDLVVGSIEEVTE